MAELFERGRSVITKYTRKVFPEDELGPRAVRSIVAQPIVDGESCQVGHFGVDVIIPVGNCVKSPRGHVAAKAEVL